MVVLCILIVKFQKLAMSSDAHWLGRKRLTTLPIKYHQTLACSLFSPHATLLLFPFFSVKLTKSFFLDLRMFLKAATLVASLDKRENGSSKIQSYVAAVCQYVFLLEMKS